MMEVSDTFVETSSEGLPSVNISESGQRECVNTMQHDDEQHQDPFIKANSEHTTHVHTSKTADFMENELMSNFPDIHPSVINANSNVYLEDTNDAVQNITTDSDYVSFDRNVGVETVVSTNTADAEDGNEVENNTSSVVDESGEKKEKFDIQKLNYELQVGYKILMSLMGAGNRFVNKLFLHPVDDNFPETSEYYSKIKEPMWMYKMKDKFEDLQYNDLADFMADFKLMIENCYRFNGPDNFVSKKAQKLETMMKQKIALLSKELRTKIMGSSNTEDEVLASAGIRRRVRNPNLEAEDESQALLSQLRRDKAIQEREDRRQRVEDRKALEAARIQEIQNWEDEFITIGVKESLQTMWELPQIGMFVYLCMECLGLEEEVTQYQLERGLVAPRECSDFRRLMTCLLSTQNQRRSVKSYMPYTVWNKKLAQKLDHFYKVLADCGGNQQQACYKLGFDNRAFKVMGKSNPLLKKQFHQLKFLKRVWIIKNYCDHCVESQSYLQKTIEEKEAERPMDVREVLLGSDGRGYRYVNFPMFTGKDIRIYRHPKLSEPSLNSLGMEGWSMMDDKPSASSSRCSTPVNQKRHSEPQSSSLRARAILQAAESTDPSPVRASPDPMQDENSNSNQGIPDPNTTTKGSSSYKRRKRTGYTGRRKRLKTSASRKELLMIDEFTDSPGTATEKEEDGGSVRGDEKEDSQGFNVPKFNSVTASDNSCDNNCNSVDATDGSSGSLSNGSKDNNIRVNTNDCDNNDNNSDASNHKPLSTSSLPSSSCGATAELISTPSNSVFVPAPSSSAAASSVAISSAKNVEPSSLSLSSPCVIQNEVCGGDSGGLRTVSDKGDDSSVTGRSEKMELDTTSGVKTEKDVNGLDKCDDVEMKASVDSVVADSKIGIGSVVSESSSGEMNSDVSGSGGVGYSKNQDSAYLSCDSDEKSFHNNNSNGNRKENGGAEEEEMRKNVEKMEDDGENNGDKTDVKIKDVKLEYTNGGSDGECEETKPKLETSGGDVGGVDWETPPPPVVKQEPDDDDGGVNAEGEEATKRENECQKDMKTEDGQEADIKEEPVEEESDEEDLPDLGRIELVAESMEGIRNLMNKLSNPEPIKRGKRVYPGVMKPCEEELLENLTRFHDELIKYEKSLFNARIHAQIKLRKEVESYVEPKVEESKGWESETSQSSKNASDDEDETSKAGANSCDPNSQNNSGKKDKNQKSSSSSTIAPSSRKSKKSMTEFLSSAASKLATLNGDANNEDSNDSYELDISSRGRLRKRRVIPNNTEDTLLKKRKNLNQEPAGTESTSTISPSTAGQSSPSPSSSASTTTTSSIAGLHNLNQSQILSMLANAQSPLKPNTPHTSMPCQIVRFVSPSGDASSYRAVRFISPGAGGKPNMVLASPEKLTGANIQFVSSTGVVTIPRSKLLASSLSQSSTTPHSSHPVIQNLLKGQGGKVGASHQLIFQKNVHSGSASSSSAIRHPQQQHQLQHHVGDQRLLTKMLSSSTSTSNIRMPGGQIVGATGIVKQQHPVVTMKSTTTSSSSTSSTTAVVVTQVPNSFISQGGKQVLDLGNLSVSQIQQLVKNQAIQINTGAGNSTTLLLTTGLQQLSAAAASSKAGSGGVASTTLASAGSATVVGGNVQQQIKVPLPNMAAGGVISNTALIGDKGLVPGQQPQQLMTVIPRNNLGNVVVKGNNSQQHQGLPVIRTIINRPPLNAVKTTLPMSMSSLPGTDMIGGQNVSVIGLANQQHPQQMPGLFTIVSGVGATAATVNQIPAGNQTTILHSNNNQTGICVTTSVTTPSISNIPPAAVNLNNTAPPQQLFTIVSGSGGGAALKQIPNPRIISSLNNQNIHLITTTTTTSCHQGPPNSSTAIVHAANKENPPSNNNNTDTKPSSALPGVSVANDASTVKHNWVTIPTKKYAGNVTVKALLENRNGAKKTETDLNNSLPVNSNSNVTASIGGSGNVSIQPLTDNTTVDIGSINHNKQFNYHNITSQLSEILTSSSLPSTSTSHVQSRQVNEDKTSESSSVPITQSLSVDAALQPLLVSALQVSLPTVNIKVPSPNTLPSMTHNKHSTTIVQSTKVPIPVASTVESSLSPSTKMTNATSSMISIQALQANGSTITTSTTTAGIQSVPSQNTSNSSTNSITSTIITPKSHTQMVLNLNNVITNTNNLNAGNASSSLASANPNPALTPAGTDMKNVMLKLTPPKGGTGQFVQGYMTSQGKLVIPQAALLPQQQQATNQQQAQQILQTGPTRVILANHNSLATSQPNHIIQSGTKIPTALIGSGNNGSSSQIRLAAPLNSGNGKNVAGNVNINNILNVANQAPAGVQIVGQQNNQLVLAAQQLQQSNIQQQQIVSIPSSSNLSARAIPVQSGNPGIKLMLINPSGLQQANNSINSAATVQTIQQQQQKQQQQQPLVKVNRSSIGNVGNANIVMSSTSGSSQQNHLQHAVRTSTPASELVKQIAANSSQQLQGVTVQQHNSNVNSTKNPQQASSHNVGPASLPQSQNQTSANLATQILTLQQQQQLGNKIQPQQIHGSQLVLKPPQQPSAPSPISVQLQNVNQILSPQNVAIRGLAPQLLQQQQHQSATATPTPKPLAQAQMVQLAINAQNASGAPSLGGSILTQPRVVQVAGQLSPQIQLTSQNPLQATIMPQLIIQQQQQQLPNAASLQPPKQLIGSSSVLQQPQHQNNNNVISQTQSVGVQQQQQPQSSIIPIQQQQPKLITTQTMGPAQATSQGSTNPQQPNPTQAQIQFVLNPSVASTANLATRLAKPVMHPVIRAVASSSSSSSSLSSPSSSSSKSPSSSKPNQIILSQTLPLPAPSTTSQFIISPLKGAAPQAPRLITPLKLVAPVQQQTNPSACLTDQRTSQLVMQNTSQLQTILEDSNNKYLPLASNVSTLAPRPPGVIPPSVIASGSTTSIDQQATTTVGGGNLVEAKSVVAPSLNLKPQNLLMASVAAVGSSSLPSASQAQFSPVTISMNGSVDSTLSSSSSLSSFSSSWKAADNQHQNGIQDSSSASLRSEGGPQHVANNRRNTFCGSQEVVAKLATPVRQKSMDDSMTSDENDEKEAALNLLTLANQPM